MQRLVSHRLLSSGLLSTSSGAAAAAATRLDEAVPQASGLLWQLVRHKSSTPYMVLPMPKMSHEMTKGTIVSWDKKQGEPFKRYDILASISTDELEPEGMQAGKDRETATMLIEAQDDGVLANLLVEAGAQVAVGTPLAVIAETQEEAERLKGEVPKTKDVYDQQQEQVPVFMWQAHREAGSAGPKGGCMS